MGLFSRLMRRGGAQILPSASALAHQPTHPEAITPNHPGNLAPRRSQPVLTDYHSFSTEETAALEERLADRQQESENFQEALKSLSEMEKLDGKDQSAYRGYQQVVAQVELGKKQSDAKLINALQAQREDYAQIQQGATRASLDANRSVENTLSKIRGWMNGR